MPTMRAHYVHPLCAGHCAEAGDRQQEAQSQRWQHRHSAASSRTAVTTAKTKQTGDTVRPCSHLAPSIQNTITSVCNQGLGTTRSHFYAPFLPVSEVGVHGNSRPHCWALAPLQGGAAEDRLRRAGTEGGGSCAAGWGPPERAGGWQDAEKGRAASVPAEAAQAAALGQESRGRPELQRPQHDSMTGRGPGGLQAVRSPRPEARSLENRRQLPCHKVPTGDHQPAQGPVSQSIQNPGNGSVPRIRWSLLDAFWCLS